MIVLTSPAEATNEIRVACATCAGSHLTLGRESRMTELDDLFGDDEEEEFEVDDDLDENDEPEWEEDEDA